MKVRPFSTTVITLLLTLLFNTSVNAASGDLKAEIITANKAFMATFQAGDATAMSNLYTEDGSLMPTNSDFLTGKKAIAAMWASVFKAGITQAKLETLEVEGLGGDTLYEVGKYTLFVKDGKEADSGKYIVIWKMKKGQWKMYRDIFNSSMPPAK